MNAKKCIIFWFFVLLFMLPILNAGELVNGQIMVRTGYTNISVFDIPGDVPGGSSLSLGLPSALIEDDFNMFNNPSQLMQYGTAYGELWNGEAWGGATVKLFDIKFGVFLGRPYEGYANNFINAPASPNAGFANTAGYINNYVTLGNITGVYSAPFLTAGTILLPVNHIDVFTGIKFDGLAIGAKFTYADNSDKVEFESVESPTNTAVSNFGTVASERKTADHHITLGFLFMGLGPFRTLDVSFDLGLLSFENSYKEGSRKDHKTAENIMKSDNSPTLQFLVRPIMDLSIGTLIVPINLVLADTSSTGTRRHDMDGDGIYTNKLIPDVHDDFKLEDKTTQLGVDMALHTRPTKELRVIYATGMSLTKRNIKSTIMSNLGNANTIKEESETTALTIPLGVSVEHQTLSWLLLRFGAHKIIYAQNKTDATDEQYTGNVLSHSLTDTKDASRNINNELQITLGLGMKPMDKLDVDFALTAAVNATYSFDSIVSRLSLKYHY